MHIFQLNEQTLAEGKKAFAQYRAALLCGPSSAAYETGIYERQTGLRVVPGAIMAIIESGMTLREEIIGVASRVSRCERPTVAAILDTLADPGFGQNPWSEASPGTYVLTKNKPGECFPTLLAA